MNPFTRNKYMVNTLKILILIMSCAALSCSKENSDVFIAPANAFDTAWVTNPDQYLKADFRNLLDTMASVPLEKITLDLQNSQSLVLGYNIVVNIPGGSFLSQSGADATGSATTRISYLSTRGDLVRNRVSVCYNDHPLYTVGAFQISFSQQGKELSLKPGKQLEVFINDPNPQQGLTLFTRQAGTMMNNWIPASYGSVYVSTNPAQKGYYFSMRQLQWLMPGQMLDSAKTTTITAYLPNIFTNTNTKLYLVLKDRKGIIELKNDVTRKFFFANKIPLNIMASIISISSVNNAYYVGTVNAVINDRMDVKIEPTRMSLIEMMDFINKL